MAYGFTPHAIDPLLKVGVARNVRSDVQPLNGLRVAPTEGTFGWYLWAGEHISEAEDFFEPLHIEHLVEWCPAALPYLELPPGWRFLIAPGHEDVWFDPMLDLTGNVDDR